jgi:hypothetical protein
VGAVMEALRLLRGKVPAQHFHLPDEMLRCRETLSGHPALVRNDAGIEALQRMANNVQAMYGVAADGDGVGPMVGRGGRPLADRVVLALGEAIQSENTSSGAWQTLHTVVTRTGTSRGSVSVGRCLAF